MHERDTEVHKVGDRAKATGDLDDDLDNLYGRIVFNMARASEAALAALGELDGEPMLPITMTNPAEIHRRAVRQADRGRREIHLRPAEEIRRTVVSVPFTKMSVQTSGQFCQYL